MFIIFFSLLVIELLVLNKRITSFYFSSQMDNKKVFDAFSASGSAEIKFSAGMYKHEEIKQENFDGWDAAA